MALSEETTAAPASIPAPAVAPAVSRRAPDAAPRADLLPKLLLKIRELNHPGVRVFLSAVNPAECMVTGITTIRRLFYAESAPPPTRSITLILRDMSDIAYTTWSELDEDHKEIHISLSYLSRIRGAGAAEIAGVITHELVHCFLHKGFDTCPDGLDEGVADWVRLRSGLVPPHWKRDAGYCWDAGYDTTAYFLEYLEGRFCGLVARINDKLRTDRYDERTFWQDLTQTSVHQLWRDYRDSLGCKDEVPEGEPLADAD